MVGIGLPHMLNPPEASVATASEQSLLTSQGDVIRHYFDSAGRIIHWEGEDRMIAVSPDQLRRARLSIGVAADEAKAGSIIGAARARMVNAVVTDVRTAEVMLDLLDGQSAGWKPAPEA